MAQLVEQLIRNQQAIGSSPITSSKGIGRIERPTDPHLFALYQLLAFGGTAHGMKERRQSEPFYPAGIPNLTLAPLPSV